MKTFESVQFVFSFSFFFVTSLINSLKITDLQAGVDAAAELAVVSKQHMPGLRHEGCLWHRVCLAVGAAWLSNCRCLFSKLSMWVMAVQAVVQAGSTWEALKIPSLGKATGAAWALTHECAGVRAVCTI